MKDFAKTIDDSRTEHVEILSQGVLNGYNRLFGGKLMQWIDVVAAVVARRHCNKNVTTASVDHLVFQAPAHANDTLILEGYITYAGKTSMEICVETYVENLDGSRISINKAYLIMVAIDDEGKPASVPPLVAKSKEDEEIMESALKRKQFRKVNYPEMF